MQVTSPADASIGATGLKNGPVDYAAESRKRSHRAAVVFAMAPMGEGQLADLSEVARLFATCDAVARSKIVDHAKFIASDTTT